MNATGRDVGLNRALQATKHPVFMGDSVELAQGLELFSCNARSHPFGSKSFGLSVQRNDVTEPDDFWHATKICRFSVQFAYIGRWCGLLCHCTVLP